MPLPRWPEFVSSWQKPNRHSRWPEILEKEDDKKCCCHGDRRGRGWSRNQLSVWAFFSSHLPTRCQYRSCHISQKSKKRQLLSSGIQIIEGYWWQISFIDAYLIKLMMNISAHKLREMWGVTDFERGFLLEVVFGGRKRENKIVQGV